MTFLHLVFYVFAAITVVAAAGVVTVKNPVKAALFLVLAFVGASGVWLTLEAEFLGIVLILVYVGAVMVLFLFVVMMLDIDVAEMRTGFARYLPIGALVAIALVVEMALILGGTFDSAMFPERVVHGVDYSNIKELGAVMYTKYVLAFEIAGLVLLVAMIAAISLTMRERRTDNKSVNPAQQVVVKKEDRLRIVKVEAEKGGEQ